MSNIYNFNENQLQQIAELRSDKYKDLWSNVLYGYIPKSRRNNIF